MPNGNAEMTPESEISDAFTFLDDGDDNDDDDETADAVTVEDSEFSQEVGSTDEAMAEFEFLKTLGDDSSESSNNLEGHSAVRSHGAPTPSMESTGSPSRESEDASLDLSKKWHKRPGRRQLVSMLQGAQAEGDFVSATSSSPTSSVAPGQEVSPGCKLQDLLIFNCILLNPAMCVL